MLPANLTENSFAKTITPIIISVFAVYLTIGITLGVLPGFVKTDLHSDSLVLGVVIGLQSLATLLTRAYAGKLTDTKGVRRSNHSGILLVVLSSIIYFSATFCGVHTGFALGLVVLARITHGISESFLVTGALTWGIGLVGPQRSGKVMTWNGIAMYAGIAIGAPAAIWMKNTYGIAYVFAIITLLSLISWLSTCKVPSLPVDASKLRTPFYKVINLIATQGVGLAFSSIGFACISSFISLLFSTRHWGDPSMAFFSFGSFYILTRVFCASFPDRFGGYRVAFFSLIVEAAGQLLIGLATSREMAILGCSLTGVGFSLIFPALGVLAIKKVTPQMRGTALGAYVAFFDLSLAIAAPVAGIVAGWFNYQAVYMLGVLSCILALLILFLKRDR